MRDTTPLVTEMVSPPIGYPTTVTASCRRGRDPNSTGVTSSQNSSLLTVNIAAQTYSNMLHFSKFPSAWDFEAFFHWIHASIEIITNMVFPGRRKKWTLFFKWSSCNQKCFRKTIRNIIVSRYCQTYTESQNLSGKYKTTRNSYMEWAAHHRHHQWQIATYLYHTRYQLQEQWPNT